MKRLAPYVFTILYIAAMVRPVAPLFNFVINQDYIAEFLCINTDKPELACNGKCYLMQMIQEQEDNNKKELPRINIGEYPIGFVQIMLLPARINFNVYAKTFFGRKDTYSYLFSFSDFHPPTLSA